MYGQLLKLEHTGAKLLRVIFIDSTLPQIIYQMFIQHSFTLKSLNLQVNYLQWSNLYFKIGNVCFLNKCTRENIDTVPTFIHMKSHVQNIPDTRISEVWSETLPTYYNSYSDFKIGNFQQLYPFHYVEKDWITDNKIKQMEKDYANTN